MTFLIPEEALKDFGLYGALDVADMGAGAGHFSLLAAKRLEGGRIFSVDISKDAISRIAKEAKKMGIKNLHPVWGDLARLRGVPLADDTLDRVIATNILFQVDDRDIFVQEIKRLLKKGGKVLLVDWKPESHFGPHTHHRVHYDTVLGLFERHGFKKERDVRAGDYHYGIMLSRD